MTTTRRAKLGQHFLISDSYRYRVADALAIRPDDLVLEIGPGRGAMTGLLMERAGKVVAVEVDPELASQLRGQFTGNTKLEILEADIVTVDIGEICRRHDAQRLFAFGNLPYYITSPILNHLLKSAERIRGMAFVVQREVAERIAAEPGSRTYGYLSVLVQTYCRPRVAFNIPPGAFSPPPAVHSALITLDMPGALTGPHQDRAPGFLEFVKVGFGQKRKKLANNLNSAYPRSRVNEALRTCQFDGNIRAEQLAVSDLFRLFDVLSAKS